MRRKRLSTNWTATLAIFAASLFPTCTWAAPHETVLYSFAVNRDGAGPLAGVIFDAAGNLYGTTERGGPFHDGTAFKLTPQAGGWTETELHRFGYKQDGSVPSGLMFNAAGKLYGTTLYGGAYGEGTVFELTPKASGFWAEKVLHSFKDKDGKSPYAGLIFDVAGNLYGTTGGGGALGFGTVFELTPTAGGDWTERVLHSFNRSHGSLPVAGLTFDAAGNLYGTTLQGGSYGYGVVFELTPGRGGRWTEKVLHSFKNKDGKLPIAGLIFDVAGNLYGTANQGGAYDDGVVFELIPTAGGHWTEKVLHSFNYSSGDGSTPGAALIFDTAGKLYSTTIKGGGVTNRGTVFQLTPVAGGRWKEKLLFRFVKAVNGLDPWAELIFDSLGNLYSTTAEGGAYKKGGTVFEITP